MSREAQQRDIPNGERVSLGRFLPSLAQAKTQRVEMTTSTSNNPSPSQVDARKQPSSFIG